MTQLEEDSTLVDALEDPFLEDDPFFASAKCCWLIKNPKCILPVRDQKETKCCYAFVVTATMYAEEVLKRGSSSPGSTQEFMDYMHRFRRPKALLPKISYIVSDQGYGSNYRDAFRYVMTHAFRYVMTHRLSLETAYLWIALPTYKNVDDDSWDGNVIVEQRIIPLEEKISLENFAKIDPKLVEKQLDKQPITGRIRMSETLLYWRSKEIFKGFNGEEELGFHAITVVGYGGEGDDAYYLCQNSYGREWGYKGYFKLNRKLVSGFFIPKGTCSPRNRQNEDASSTTKESGAAAAETGTMGSRAAKRRRLTSYDMKY